MKRSIGWIEVGLVVGTVAICVALASRYEGLPLTPSEQHWQAMVYCGHHPFDDGMLRAKIDLSQRPMTRYTTCYLAAIGMNRRIRLWDCLPHPDRPADAREAGYAYALKRFVNDSEFPAECRKPWVMDALNPQAYFFHHRSSALRLDTQSDSFSGPDHLVVQGYVGANNGSQFVISVNGRAVCSLRDVSDMGATVIWGPPGSRLIFIRNTGGFSAYDCDTGDNLSRFKKLD